MRAPGERLARDRGRRQPGHGGARCVDRGGAADGAADWRPLVRPLGHLADEALEDMTVRGLAAGR